MLTSYKMINRHKTLRPSHKIQFKRDEFKKVVLLL